MLSMPEHFHFPYSADHEQDWQPYPVDLYSAISYNNTYMPTVTEILIFSVQLTTSRIDNFTRLIHNMLQVMTIHTYCITLPG